MWRSSNTQTAKSSLEALWQHWTDVANWPQQDASLESASINGDFQVGSIITLKPKGSPTVKVRLIEVKPCTSFSTIGKLPLTKLQFYHYAAPTSAGIEFTQSVTMTGPLSGLFSLLFGKKMTDNLKARMSKLAELLNAQ